MWKHGIFPGMTMRAIYNTGKHIQITKYTLDIVDEHFISILCSPKHAAFPKHFLCHQAKELSGQPTRSNSSFAVAFIIGELNRDWKFNLNLVHKEQKSLNIQKILVINL